MITIEDLTEKELKDLIDRTVSPTDPKNRDRRKEMWLRYMAMKERPDELIRSRIAEVFHQPTIKREVQLWATGIFNPVRRLSEKIAKAYSVSPLRSVEKIGVRANKEFSRTLRQLRFNARGKAWNQWSVAMNTVIMLVRPATKEDGSPTLDFIRQTGANTEIIPHPDAPFGDTPGMIAYTLDIEAERRLRSVPLANEEAVAIVDGRWWSFWTREGKFVRAVEHGLGRFPGAQLRATEPDGNDSDDHWDPDFGRSMTAALKESGLAGAIMGWTRKTLFGKLVAITREDEPEAAETEGEALQVMGHPEAPIELSGARVDVHDLEVGVEQFQRHMGLMLAEAAHALTGTASILEEPTPGQALTDTATAQRQSALRGLQNEQTDYLEPFEGELLEVMGGMAQVIGMRGLPTPEQIREGYRVQFIPQTALGTPSEQLNVAITGTKFGATNVVQFVMRTQGLSEGEAIKEVLRLAKQTAEINEIRVTRNSPADPTETGAAREEVRPELPGEGVAAATGRAGGRASPPPA